MSETTNNTESTRIAQPRVDIVEKDGDLLLFADMAGVSADNLDITLENNELTLHGKATDRDVMYQRAFTIGRRIDRDNIVANVKDGVLTLTLPRLPEAEPKKIAVQAA